MSAARRRDARRTAPLASNAHSRTCQWWEWVEIDSSKRSEGCTVRASEERRRESGEDGVCRTRC